MTREEVLGKIREIILKHFDIEEDKIVDELNIAEDLGADSISIMEFVLELEDEFDTEISDEDAENIATVGAAIDYILSHQ
ncbi:acyl carrier protein [Vagococcus acidifermentans]|uniref:Acyl carrier protein n=1 Tax=Vagococcus acidifermentans TaxID=564710 RepID=A0A430AUR3_9ENTE|nr:acyl carrier protein [Vagococcus acidifermentans]RSU11791.1 acyl carrier protein [Vagococcus acidifermentans]